MLSRRRFVAGVTSGLTLGGITWPLQLRGASRRSNLSSTEQRWLREVLPVADRRYDPFAKMIVTSASTRPGDHTTLKSGDVHATRASLTYAVALLDTGERRRVERAREILRAVIALQDQDLESNTYGLWPWCLEEPLAMLPPDGNWSDFCGMQLMMAWIEHREQLGSQLADEARESILHAARSIQRRNVAPAHTSSAITGTSLALVAAREFKLADLRTYARERLRRLYDHVIQQGSFTEYNSPTDSIVALQELSRMLWLVKDARDRQLITAVHDLGWKHVATHFHAPTQQWAGPHSRSSETDLRKQPETLAFLQAACGDKVHFDLSDPLPLSFESYRLPLQCPARWAKLFVKLDAPRQVVETFVQPDPATAGSRNPVIGTTWLHPRLTLGSVNRGDFWRQRRSLLAYWGTPAAPSFLQLRFLKNDHDFASALLFTVQHESSVLGVITFATDHGDTHPSLDKISDAKFTAKDLRLRFEFGGHLSGLVLKNATESEKYLVFQDRDVRFALRPVADNFGGQSFRWDEARMKLAKRIDAVAYEGEEKLFDLASLGEAFACFTLEEWPYGQKQLPPAKVEWQKRDGRLRARWLARGKTLDLDVPIKPGPYTSLNDSFRSAVS